MSESQSGSGRGSAVPPSAARAASGSGTMTVTETATETAQQASSNEVLRLTLRDRPTVRWDEDVVDNEGLGRKSSKRCCIFHKQRAFDESSTDSSDENNSDGEEDGKPSAKMPKKIARPKNSDKPPDYQRFHA